MIEKIMQKYGDISIPPPSEWISGKYKQDIGKYLDKNCGIPSSGLVLEAA